MIKITDNWDEKSGEFKHCGIHTPVFDIVKMKEKTLKVPHWIHFGGGNLYRCFHAKIAQDLLNQGFSDTGVVVAEIFSEPLSKLYEKNNNRSLSVILKEDGNIKKELIASTAEFLFLNKENFIAIERVKSIFSNPSLQIVTLTITEKGYLVRGLDGEILPQIQKDIDHSPVFEEMESTMGKIAALLYERYQSGAFPLALISTDNFSNNGERFKQSILIFVKGWIKNGKVEKEFLDYVENGDKITFPYSMIDRITPLPSKEVASKLENEGIEKMNFPDGSTFAPFVNTEEIHYLVIENDFPNGQPGLEKAGVFLTDRETVNKADLMKVCTCLNPLHTALAIFGCMLGFDQIWAEMKDSDLLQLVQQLGYVEGLPVVADPKIINPKKFLDEVVYKRLVNPFIPDSPQRIATDTSQKLGVRYGETIKSYLQSDSVKVESLNFIPLTIAAWIRYLLAIDDEGMPLNVSPDPLLGELREHLSGVSLGKKVNNKDILCPILSSSQIFGLDLQVTLLASKIEDYFEELISAPGAVRTVLGREVRKYSYRLETVL